jgi:DNA-binding LacI/PurR family transcriptional regulator
LNKLCCNIEEIVLHLTYQKYMKRFRYQMKITIKDIAKLAGVSVATASLALNNKAGVNERTREKVLDAVKRFNYTPNQYARSLITQKSGTIGLVVTDITNPFFGMLVDEINNAVLAAGYNLLLGVSNDNIDNEHASIHTFMRQRVEGIIIVPCVQRTCDLSHIYQLKSNNIPFIFSTTAYPGIDADCIMTDLKEGSYLMTRYLLETGHRKIYLITGYRELLLSSMRIEGYRKAYGEVNMQYNEDWIIETIPNYENGYKTTEKLLQSKPDAITAINDVLALGVIKCLKDNNICVPQEISVAGYDDLIYTSLLETPLSTIRQPVADIAKKSVEMLVKRINGCDEPASMHYVAPVLKIRATTR